MRRVIVIICCLMVLMTGCNNVETSDDAVVTDNSKEVYTIIKEIRNDEREAHSEMVIFPLEEVDYQETLLHEENFGLSTAHQIYVKTQYDEQSFYQEIRRLLQAKSRKNMHTYYTEEEFTYPAIVAVYNSNNCYEYALINENDLQISYVCNTFIDNLDFIDVANRPVDYEKLSKKDYQGYTIY